VKITAETKPLIEAVAFAVRIAKSKFSRVRPIFGCVKIIAETMQPLRLEAHGGEMWASITVEQAVNETPGIVCVSAERLLLALNNCANDPTVVLEEDGPCLHVRGDRTRTDLRTCPVQDYPPPLDIGEAKATVGVRASEFESALAKVSGFQSPETSNYAIAGVLVRRNERNLAVVAHDGVGMAEVKLTMPKAAAKAEVIMHAEAVRTAREAMKQVEGGVSVECVIGTSGVAMTVGTVTFHSSGVEGAFPSYEDHIPGKSEAWFECSGEDLARAVQSATTMLEDTKKAVRFTRENGHLKIEGNTAEVGSCESVVDAKANGGVPNVFATRPRYLLSAIDGAGTAIVRLEVESSKKPCVMRSGDGSFTAVWAPFGAA